jgi:flagellar biosynthesis protein FlhA
MSPGATPASGLGSALARLQELILPIAIIASVLVIVVPLPAALLDLLLAANISAAVIILLTTIYVRTPLEFSVFPSVLLAATLGRLVLNVAVTRLILTRADRDGLDAAGGVVRGFGEFVAGDKVVVGLIIFAIVAVIQFVVISKGATRISEVAARFALDGMPGRQMAVDADLSAGIIDQREAQRRRGEITRQADFFGAMDGASKFVRGDAIAGIVITLVNIVGGLFIGVIQEGMTISAAAALFTKLTIGDGLVSQVPAFLTSLAAGMLVTRSTNEVNLPMELIGQLFSRPRALAVTGGFLAILVLANLPALPLVALGTGCVGLALTVSRRQTASRSAADGKAALADQKPVERRIEDYLSVDPMEIEIGAGLIRLADPKRGGDLLARVQDVRQKIAAEIGIVVPKVRIRDNLRLEPNAYRIKLADMPIGEAVVLPNMLLAIDPGQTAGRIPGSATREPAFNTPAVWIEPGQRERAERLGYTVVEPSGVLATHLTELVRKHADEILTRDATKHLIDELKRASPAAVEELIPAQLKLAEVQQILQMLLREGISIRPLGPIVEALGDLVGTTKDASQLTEYVRQRLARTICSRFRDAERRLRVATLEPDVEDRLRTAFEQTQRPAAVRMPPRTLEDVCRTIAAAVEPLEAAGYPPIVLVSPQIRAAVRKVTAPHLPQLHVLSYAEITRDTQVEVVGNDQ